VPDSLPAGGGVYDLRLSYDGALPRGHAVRIPHSAFDKSAIQNPMTYSIIARDPRTGHMGAAVQTFNLAVGTWVPWARAAVGVVATQASADRRYGTSGLDLMAGGYTAEGALQALLAADPQRETRQVSMIDSAGRIATHTGACCIPEAGSCSGDTYCAQANMMANDTVWPEMAAAFESAEGPLANRLLAALDAAQAAGGDLRGRQTAALLVVDSRPSAVPLVDLRVDHDPDPLGQLRRMLRLHEAYMLEYEVADNVQKGELAPVPQQLDRLGELAPDESYLQCLRALHFERALGMREAALNILQPLIAAEPQWRIYLERELAASEAAGCADFDPGLLLEMDQRRRTGEHSK
jgi:uncharacterized Ntn-hydrolase superfamily protein